MIFDEIFTAPVLYEDDEAEMLEPEEEDINPDKEPDDAPSEGDKEDEDEDEEEKEEEEEDWNETPKE